jgi:hypothetical protein
MNIIFSLSKQSILDHSLLTPVNQFYKLHLYVYKFNFSYA